MKTLCFTLGLLLITVCCCDVVIAGYAGDITQAGLCCFGFSTSRVPPRFVVEITKTHSSCVNKAYIVRTKKGKQFCYRDTFQWNLNPYKN